MDFKEVLKKRQSCRSYLYEKISKEDLDEILEAGIKAPIAKGRYGDYKIFVYSDEKLKEIQRVAKEVTNADFTFGCPLLILVAYKGEENEPMEQSVGAIIENMELCASNLDLNSVFVYTIKRVALANEAFKNTLNLGEYTPEACLCVGKGKDFKFIDKHHEILVEKYSK